MNESMKKLFLFSICILLFTPRIEAQTYELLNDVFQHSKNGKVFLKSKFESLNNEKFIKTYLTQSFIKDNWEPLPSDKIPDSSLFFDQVSLEHVRAVVLVAPLVEEIDFSKLNESFVKVENENEHFKVSDSFQIISKPIFSCDKQWAILYRYSVFKTDVGNSGDIYIYKIADGKWHLFHKITLWMS